MDEMELNPGWRLIHDPRRKNLAGFWDWRGKRACASLEMS